MNELKVQRTAMVGTRRHKQRKRLFVLLCATLMIAFLLADQAQAVRPNSRRNRVDDDYEDDDDFDDRPSREQQQPESRYEAPTGDAFSIEAEAQRR